MCSWLQHSVGDKCSLFVQLDISCCYEDDTRSNGDPFEFIDVEAEIAENFWSDKSEVVVSSA